MTNAGVEEVYRAEIRGDSEFSAKISGLYLLSRKNDFSWHSSVFEISNI